MDYRIGIVELGIMGRSLALNMERNGFLVAGYDMKPATLQSQFDTLEEPQDALTVDASLPVADIVSIILKDYNRKRP